MILTSALAIPAKPCVVEVEETDDESSEEENSAVLKLIKKSEKKVAAHKPQQATKVSSFQVSSTRPSVGAGKGSTQPPPTGPSFKAAGDQNVPPPGTTPKPSPSEWKPVQETNIVKGSTQEDFRPKVEGKTKPSGQISSVMAERLAMFQGSQKREPERQEAPRRKLVSNVARLFNKDEDDDDHQNDAKPLPRKSVLSRWMGKEKEEDSSPLHSAVKRKQKEYRRRSDSEEEHEQPRRSRDRRQSDDSSGDRRSQGKKAIRSRKSHKSESESESDGGSSHQQRGKERKHKEDVKRHTKEPQKETVVNTSTNATIDVLSQLIMGDTVVQPAPAVSEEIPLGGDNLLHSLAIQTGLVEPKPDPSLKALEDLLSLPPEPSVPPPPSQQQLQPRKASTTGQVEEFPIQEETDQPSTHSKDRNKPQTISQSDVPSVIDIDIGQEQQVLQPRPSKKTSLHMNSANFFVNLPVGLPSGGTSIYAPAPLEPLPPPPPLATGPPSSPAFVYGSHKKHSAGSAMPTEDVQAERDALLHQIRSKAELEKVDQEEIESSRQQMKEEAKQQSKSAFVRELESRQSMRSQNKGSRRSSRHEESMHPNGEVEESLHQDHDSSPRSEGHERRGSVSDKQRRRTSQDGDMERDGGSHRRRRSSTTRRVDDVDGKDRRSSARPEPFPDSGDEDLDAPFSYQEMNGNEAENRAAHHQPSDQHEHARSKPLPPPQPIALDEEDEDLPEWKQKLLYQKRLRATAEIRAQKQAERDEEERFLGVPEWKVKLIKKKEAEKAVVEECEKEKQAERHERLARIASMPEWKRKLYMAKNPSALS